MIGLSYTHIPTVHTSANCDGEAFTGLENLINKLTYSLINLNNIHGVVFCELSIISSNVLPRLHNYT